MGVTEGLLRILDHARFNDIRSGLASMLRMGSASGAKGGDDGRVFTTATPNTGPLGEAHAETVVGNPAGFSSAPSDGSSLVLLAMGGDPSHSLALPAGGAAVGGARVTLVDNGDIELTPGEGGVVRMGKAESTKAAVARSGDPTELDTQTTLIFTTMQTMLSNPAVLALLNGVAGGSLLPVPPPTVPSQKYTGSITAGGEGSTSS